MRLNKTFSLIQARVALLMRPVAIVCACLVVFCSTSAELFGGSEYVIVVKVLQSNDKGIIERKNGERWLIENGAGALSFRRYEGKKVLIDSPVLFCGVGSKMILPDDDQEARIWNAELLDDHPTRLVSDPSVFRGLAENGDTENGIKGVSFVSGTVPSGMTAEASDSSGSVETIPNRFLQSERVTHSRPGLLGKRHASAQVLVGWANSDGLWGVETTGVGWRTHLNAPLLPAENEAVFGMGVDVFGELGDVKFSGHGTNRVFNEDADFFVGRGGVNVFFEVTDSVRPFVQLGVGFNRAKRTISDSNGSTVYPSANNSGLLFGVGAEFDIIQSIAFRTTFMPDLNGSNQINFVNELIVNPQDRWFLRLTVDSYSGAGVRGITGGIGAGIIW